MISFAQPRIADFDDMKRKIQAFLHIFDGKVKPYGEIEDAFDDLFHEACRFRRAADGRRTMDREQMREAADFFLSTGTSVDLLLYERMGERTFQVKLQLANRLADIQTHLKGTIEDGKLIRIEACEESKRAHANVKRMAEIARPRSNFEHFLHLQNDKDASVENLQDAFDGLFYDSLVAAIGRTQLHKRGMRTTSSVPDDFDGAKFTLEKFEVMDENHLEVKVLRDCVVGDRESTREVWHDVFTVKDGAILAIEPHADFENRPARKEKKSGKRNRRTWPLPVTN